MSDAQTQAADGAEGVQGSEDTGGLYDAHLQNIPEEHREHVLPALQSLSKDFDQRFRDAADYRKQWEPYEQLGLNQYDPNELGQLIQWSQQVGNDPQALAEWVQHLVSQGVLDPNALNPQAQSPYEGLDQQQGQQDGFEDPRVAMLEQQLQELSQWRQQQEQQATEQQIIQDAHRQFSQIESELGRGLTEGQKDAIYQLGVNKDGDDWIMQGYRLFQQLGAEAQKEFVANAEQRPQSPEKGTGAPEGAEPVRSFDTAKQMARERLRPTQ